MKPSVYLLTTFFFALLMIPTTTSCNQDSVSLKRDGCGGNPNGSQAPDVRIKSPAVVTGAEVLVTEELDRIRDKKIAIVANHTSLVFGNTHLVDTLTALGIKVVKVFAPEHGFRGDHDAGARVDASTDQKTGIKIESLYGSNKKPSVRQLADVDLVLFDIQDVGARFYTYISTMSYVMEACAEQKKQFLVLDRPNPNGWYADGPVLEKGMESFVGMHKVPIVHGMTVGEYARMVNGESWLKNGVKTIMEVVPCKNYNHNLHWEDMGLDWVAPSPNLATPHSAYLYPIFCWFEGMPVSVGRGTDRAFEVVGAPWHAGYQYQIEKDSITGSDLPSSYQSYGLQFEYIKFTPRSIPGKSTRPKFMDQACFGARGVNEVDGKNTFMAGIAMLKNFYTESGNSKSFKGPLFQPFFAKIAGTESLQEQIERGMTEAEIYESWQPALAKFKLVRRKYLLYPDFESK